jgi:hypothetical protein
MVETSGCGFRFNAGVVEEIDDFFGYFFAALVGELLFIVVGCETVKTGTFVSAVSANSPLRVWTGWHVLIDQVGLLGCIDLDHVGLTLPMGREYNDGFWLNFLRDFSSQFLKFWVHLVCSIIHDIWL